MAVRECVRLLRITFFALALICGADKFLDRIVFWQDYLAPRLPQLLGVDGIRIMHVAGAIELVLALGVLLKPRLFGYLLSAWLYFIALTLVFSWSFLDVAILDLVLALSALVLGRLSSVMARGEDAWSSLL